jgi:hypothetical protein
MLMPNFYTILETVQVIWLSIFYDFCKLIIIHPIYIVSPCSFSLDSDLSYDILNLANIANVVIEFYLAEWCC